MRRWLAARRQPPEARLHEAMEAFRDPAADTLDLIRRLVSELRPRSRRDTGAGERYAAMLARLEADAELLSAFRGHVVHFIAGRRLPIIFDDFVEREFGTGAVKITPGKNKLFKRFFLVKKISRYKVSLNKR